MFVQVIRGQVTGPEQVHDALDRWSGQLAAGAPGWLGTTAGLTGDGRFVALARFESEEAARRNSDRPEQDQWWMETSKLFAGEVIFRDSNDITVDINGDPDKAGFVQVMQGRGSDPDRARELMAQNPDEWTVFRPDVIGSVTVGHEGGAYTMAMYFTSEQAAREGERKQPPPQLKAQMDEMSQLSIASRNSSTSGTPGCTHPEQQAGRAASHGAWQSTTAPGGHQAGTGIGVVLSVPGPGRGHHRPAAFLDPALAGHAPRWSRRMLRPEFRGRGRCADLPAAAGWSGRGSTWTSAELVSQLSNAARELGADLEPRRLAIMHGSSYAGDCPALLRAMADVYERQFGCGGGGIPAQPLPGHPRPAEAQRR